MTSALLMNTFEKMTHKELHSVATAANVSELKNQFFPVSTAEPSFACNTLLPKRNSRSSFSDASSSSIVRNIRSAIGLASQAASTEPASPFIDASELKSRLFELSSRFLIILLDCRTYTEFNAKHIKDSVHVNCRDKLTRKRLQSKKLTVKDLIASEEVKSRFDDSLVTANQCIGAIAAAANVAAGATSKILSKLGQTEAATAADMIVIYDDTTSDVSDLQADSNPLKIVQENIKQSGCNKECKILKGGFKRFLEMCPEFIVSKEQIAPAKCRELAAYEQQLDQQQAAIENAVMTQITPFLYLGNEVDAKNIEKLEAEGIYYILNVTKNIPFYNLTNPKFVFKRIAVNDCENQNLKQHFDEAIEFIDEAKSKNQKVLVHCQAGISRSPTIVIAYLMNKLNLQMNEAYNKVRENRPIIAPNLIFMSQLMDYEAKLSTEAAAATTTAASANTSYECQHEQVAEVVCDEYSSSSPSLSSASSTPSSLAELAHYCTRMNEDSENSNSSTSSNESNTGATFFTFTTSLSTSSFSSSNENQTILICN